MSQNSKEMTLQILWLILPSKYIINAKQYRSQVFKKRKILNTILKIKKCAKCPL